MLRVFAAAWALFLGLMLLSVGNGVQGTLLGLRGGIEGFSTFQMSVVMSAYFVGFLFGSQVAPRMIRRVGHVRVFAALGSMISTILLVYVLAPDWIAWAALRVLIGFCFSGVYVTTESWLNNAATNETRGQTLSLYMLVQMIGMMVAQGLMNLGDPAGYDLFLLPSILVSLAFLPILLSVAPAPAFAETKRMTIGQLYRVSPLAVVGMVLVGGAFAVLSGMAAVWGTLAGLGVGQITLFIAVVYLGGMAFQIPIGALSDRIDRRRLILIAAAVGAAAAGAGALAGAFPLVLLGVALVAGGIVSPLYALLLAHANDYLEPEDMAAASGGLLFVNGVGAIAGPLLTGWLMEMSGPPGFFVYIAAMLGVLALYAAWRSTRRPAPDPADTGTYAIVTPTASPLAAGVAVTLAQEAGRSTEEEETPPSD